jgi:uncharacterized protein YggE
MDRPVTVRLGSVLLAVVMILAVAVAYLVGAAGGGGEPAQASDNAAPPSSDQRTVRMVGKGQVTAVPDMLSFTVVVTVKRADLDTALADSSTTMKSVLDRLADFGVAKGDVRTTGLSMSPEYAYHSYAPPTLTGYRVTQQARVDVRTLGQGGAAISAAVETGGNDVRVRNLQLQVSDPDAALAEARKAAIEQAKAKAQEYAGAAGGELGAVQSIREISVQAPTPRPLAYNTSADAALKSVLPIRAGESDLSVRVEVVWALG